MEFDGTEYNPEFFQPDPKPEKPVRLKGKKKIDLYRRVWERDKGLCQDCLKNHKKRYVEPGTIPHHIVFKSQGGSDTMENLKTLCQECHDKYH